MALFDVTMTSPDGENTRSYELEASDKDEARFMCEKNARELAAEQVATGGGQVNDYLYTIDKGYPKEKV